MMDAAIFRAGNRFLQFSLLLLVVCAGIYAFTGYLSILCAPFAFWYAWLMGNNWKLAWWLLLAAVPLSVDVGLFGQTLSTSLPDEPMTWMFLLLLPLLLLYQPQLISLRALANPIVVLVILQVLWVVVAVIFSGEPMLSLKYLLVKVWLLAAFFIFPFIIFRQRKDFITGFRIILAPLLLTMIIILSRHASMDFGFRQINDAIGKLYYNHVEYSTIVSMIFPLACMAWPSTVGMKRWMRLVFVAMLVVFVLAIFFSYARAAMLAVIFSTVVAISIRYRFAGLIMPAFYAIIIAVMAHMVPEHKYLDYRPDYAQTYMHDDLNGHLDATFRGTDMSGMERVYRWIAAIRMSSEKPITGYGPNTFVHQYKPYAVSAFKTYVSENTERSTTHNYFLYMLAEQGWPGMLLYALLIPIVIGVAQRTYHRFRDPFYKQCTLALVMMFAAAFVNNFFSELTDTHKVGALFYISMALIAVLSRKSKEPGVQR
jgi:O-antigen ligase